MRGNTESKRRSSRVSSVESFSEKAITKQLRRDAMRHPATLIPLGLCILFIILAFTVLEPLLAIFLIIGSGVAAGGAFFWRYSIRYNEEYTKRAQELMQQHDRDTRDREQGDLEQSREDLQTGFSRVNSVEGLKALQELVHEYEQLQPVLGRGKETDPLAIAHIPALAEETYRRGLSVLAGCVDLMREIHSPNNEKLGEEAGELEREIEALKATKRRLNGSRSWKRPLLRTKNASTWSRSNGCVWMGCCNNQIAARHPSTELESSWPRSKRTMLTRV